MKKERKEVLSLSTGVKGAKKGEDGIKEQKRRLGRGGEVEECVNPRIRRRVVMRAAEEIKKSKEVERKNLEWIWVKCNLCEHSSSCTNETPTTSNGACCSAE